VVAENLSLMDIPTIIATIYSSQGVANAHEKFQYGVQESQYLVFQKYFYVFRNTKIIF